MLAEDVVFEGFTATDWTRLVATFEPVRREDDAEDHPRGGVIALHDGVALRKLVHTRLGRLDRAAQPWPATPADLALRHRGSWSAVLRLGALDELMERFGERARRPDDLTVQVLRWLEIGRELVADGALDVWPRRLSGVPVPSADLVRRAIDPICGDGRSIVLGVFDRGQLWTALALARDHGRFHRIVGPDELRRRAGLLSGDFRRDHRYLAFAAERCAGPLALGCFAEAATLRALLAEGAPGAWARAVAVRDVVLAPLPGALAIPLGIDAARATFAVVRGVLERADPAGLVPWLSAVANAAATAAGDALGAARIGGDEGEGADVDWLALARRWMSR